MIFLVRHDTNASFTVGWMCLDVVYYRFRSLYPRLFFNLSFSLSKRGSLPTPNSLSPLPFLYIYSFFLFIPCIRWLWLYDDHHHLQLLSNTFVCVLVVVGRSRTRTIDIIAYATHTYIDRYIRTYLTNI